MLEQNRKKFLVLSLVTAGVLLLWPAARAEEPATTETESKPSPPAGVETAREGGAPADFEQAQADDVQAQLEGETASSGQPPDQGSPEQAGQLPPQEPVDPIADYLKAIEQVEISRGSYSTELADLYLGLGNLLVKDGSYLQAKDAYQKGMQVARVNNGLNSLSQEPFLYSLAELDSAMGDVKSSNQAMNHIFQINSQTFGPADERMLPVLERMYQWYLDNYPQMPPRSGFDYLLNSEKLANQMVLIHMDTLALGDEGVEDSFRKLSAVEFALARHLDVHGLPGENEAFTYSFGAPANQVSQEPAYINRYYRTGRDALKFVVKMLYDKPGVSKRELADAVVELADWYAAFDKHLTAEEHYKLAYQLLGEADETKALQNIYFARPKLITFTGEETVVDNVASPEDGLDITFDISEQGVPGNLRLEEEREGLGARDIRRIKKEVLGFRFRPKLENGELVGTRDFLYRYPVDAGEAQHES